MLLVPICPIQLVPEACCFKGGGSWDVGMYSSPHYLVMFRFESQWSLCCTLYPPLQLHAVVNITETAATASLDMLPWS